ncbi:MAG: chemotaxis protein CheV [Deltaproteobacteria bacterium]|nr:chemotaxis protein CheV [Deltaproteobacteria bacterium]
MTNTDTPQEILLESGTNEMEILEFYLGSQSFGINVQKLREILPFDELKRTGLPHSPPSLAGIFEVRGISIPLVDLNVHLQRPNDPQLSGDRRRIVLVCHFNQCTTGFLVDGVNQIHRLSWTAVNPMAHYLDQFKPRFTSSVSLDGREILIVDLEHIVAEIQPDPDQNQAPGTEPPGSAPNARGCEFAIKNRREAGIMLAEDSGIIRASIAKMLVESGYSKLTTFQDGAECYQALNRLLEECGHDESKLLENLQLIITDIEMPKMDGLTLCRRIREEMGLQRIKIIMFSSLISDEMVVKCDSVGADGCLSKPQIPQLIHLLDEMLITR